MRGRQTLANSANGRKTDQRRTTVALRAPGGNRSTSGKRRSKKTAVTYHATIYPGPTEPISAEFAQGILRLERIFNAEIWLIVQNGLGTCTEISNDLFKKFRDRGDDVEKCGDKFTILLDSPGGDADAAYRL